MYRFFISPNVGSMKGERCYIIGWIGCLSQWMVEFETGIIWGYYADELSAIVVE